MHYCWSTVRLWSFMANLALCLWFLWTWWILDTNHTSKINSLKPNLGSPSTGQSSADFFGALNVLVCCCVSTVYGRNVVCTCFMHVGQYKGFVSICKFGLPCSVFLLSYFLVPCLYFTEKIQSEFIYKSK